MRMVKALARHGARANTALKRVRAPRDTTFPTQSAAFTSRVASSQYQGNHPWHTVHLRAHYDRPLIQRRAFITDSLPTVLVPPTVFLGLLVGLWTYKCLMTVLFQDKIIYMPYMPPFARSEKMENYAAMCKPVVWEQRQIRSLDGTKIMLGVGKIAESKFEEANLYGKRRRVVICFFQGNGSSIPPRMPFLSNTLRAVDRLAAADSSLNVEVVLVALSYRGYWKSSGRASQSGIEKDSEAMLTWVHDTYASPGYELEVVLWGQSLGAGIAATAAATHVTHRKHPPLIGIVLETPFTGIKSMLLGLYPQKWLPYRYLWPFLWNHWDMEVALKRIADADKHPHVLLLPATRDEVVPPIEIVKVQKICHDLGLPTVRKDVLGALHFEASTRQEGQEAIAKFIVNSARKRLES